MNTAEPQPINPTTVNSITERMRDLQGLCTLTRNEFGEGDEMHRLFGRIALELEMMRKEITTLSIPDNCATTDRLLHMVE